MAGSDDFDAGYAQAIKDVVEDLRLNAGMCITAEAQYFNRVLAVRIESRFSAPSPETGVQALPGGRIVLLWSFDRDPTRSIPIGSAVEFPDHVAIFLPESEMVPEIEADEFRMGSPIGGIDTVKPGDEGYFDQVVGALAQTYAVTEVPVRAIAAGEES